MNRTTFYFDANDPVDIARHCNQIRAMAGTGKYHGRIERYRATRSQRQNKAYFGLVVEPFADYLTEAWGYEHTQEMAHEEIKKMVLGVEIVNPHTGEVKLVIPGTRDKDTMQFSEFFERARAEVERLIGRKIPDPDPLYFAKGVKSGRAA